MCAVRTSNTHSINHLRYVKERQDNVALSFVYNNFLGKLFLPIVISKPITTILGNYYNSKLSKIGIQKYIRKNNIDMNLFKEKEYKSFNDFFTRERKEISFSQKKKDFCAPCDGFLSAYKIENNRTFWIKGIEYSLEELLHNFSLSKKYKDGIMYIFRLVPANYHRYHYFDNGKVLMQKQIKGVFHTVRPVALEKKKVFIENTRTYSLLSTENFGDIIFLEVGALGVGKIMNHQKKSFQKGEEKGMFFFGGSTVIVIFEKNILKPDKKLLEMSTQKYEAVVQCGCKIGECI